MAASWRVGWRSGGTAGRIATSSSPCRTIDHVATDAPGTSGATSASPGTGRSPKPATVASTTV
jgi:hypothetical protein